MSDKGLSPEMSRLAYVTPHDGALALYVHWPWCKQKCPYCDFNSHAADEAVAKGEMGERYVQSVMKEIALWQRQLGPQKIRSVFFGGGTPSLMRPEWVASVLKQVSTGWVLTTDDGAPAEVTVECNPTSASRTLFVGLRDAGVNRVSVGVQGLEQSWLEFLGRAHGVGDAMTTLRDAMEIIGHVNADVIYGLPEQKLEDWETLLRELTRMGLEHVSAYQLTVEKNTAFYSQVKRGLWAPLDNDSQADFFDATRRILGAAGYENYEISNFAKPGRACAHNVHVWNYLPYVGVGAGAHGRVEWTTPEGVLWGRTQTLKMPDKYMEYMDNCTSMDGVFTPLERGPAVQEAIMMGLRLAAGFDMEALEKRFGAAFGAEYMDFQGFERMQRLGMLKRDGTQLQLTPQGWPLLDSVLREILLPL